MCIIKVANPSESDDIKRFFSAGEEEEEEEVEGPNTETADTTVAAPQPEPPTFGLLSGFGRDREISVMVSALTRVVAGMDRASAPPFMTPLSSPFLSPGIAGGGIKREREELVSPKLAKSYKGFLAGESSSSSSGKREIFMNAYIIYSVSSFSYVGDSTSAIFILKSSNICSYGI